MKLYLLVFLLGVATAAAHDLPRQPVIVDTDMALDDVRALAIVLSAPTLDVRAIVTSDGASSPATGATNVLRLLRFLGREDIPVGAGRSLPCDAPRWREQSETLGWRADTLPSCPKPINAAVAVLRAALTNTPGPVTYLCLGPLTNLADTLKTDRQLRNRLRAVIWHGTASPDWNADRDPSAVRAVKQFGVPLRAVARDAAHTPPLDKALWDEIRVLETPAARLITRTHEDERIQQLIQQEHLRLWDDSTALLLLRPGLTHWDRAVYLQALRPLTERGTVVIRKFPTDPSELLPDLRSYVHPILDRYGAEEWKAAVLTSELHRHLGTYSILGAKMGIRARELTGASLDELNVESFAGLKPPLSCFNDGLQVATGASLGRGTIRVETNGTPRCEAVFTHGRKTLRLRLKADIADRLKTEMAGLVQRHGGTTSAYFEEVRIQSLRHWLELDRAKIFEEVTIHAYP